MPASRRRVAAALLVVALASLATGLLRSGYPHRCVVDASACSRDSDYVEARGYPIAWLVSEPLPELDLPAYRRILALPLALDLTALFALTASNWLVVALSRRRFPGFSGWLVPGGYLGLQLIAAHVLHLRVDEIAPLVASFSLVALANARGGVAVERP